MVATSGDAVRPAVTNTPDSPNSKVHAVPAQVSSVTVSKQKKKVGPGVLNIVPYNLSRVIKSFAL